MTEIEKLTLNKAGKWIQENNPSNEFLVQLIELGFDYLNADTIPVYAKKMALATMEQKNSVILSKLGTLNM